MAEETVSKNFIEQEIEKDLREGMYDHVCTRFPPEPNGYLHIGHAKSILLNYGIAQEYGGTFHMRFDDTNPTKEKTEFVESILEDIRWLGADWKDHLYFASDYFDIMYECAVKLIKKGKAYVCDLTPDEIREYRGTLTEPGKNSPYRERSVEVRFMYDGTCSVSQLPYEYPEELKAKGIRCKVFAPVRPIMTTTQNNRDHRKICVIDGKVAFTGGVNLADEYINKKVRFGHWKDTAIMLKGDAVQSFTMMFLQLWNIDEKEPELYRSYLTRKHRNFSRETGYMIPYGDSPYDHENVGEEVYIHILNHAKRYVHIMTPYLILDNEMMTALKRAAKSGIEVQIIMPHIPDKPYAFYLAKTYYAELIESGVQIFEYLPGFVHAKVFTSDDDTATVGTVNLDFRSLYLHFECGVFIYHNPVVYDIEQDFQKTLAVSQKVTLTDVKNRSLLIQIYGQLLRLIAPLM